MSSSVVPGCAAIMGIEYCSLSRLGFSAYKMAPCCAETVMSAPAVGFIIFDNGPSRRCSGRFSVCPRVVAQAPEHIAATQSPDRNRTPEAIRTFLIPGDRRRTVQLDRLVP